jgi:hypothetical protein
MSKSPLGGISFFVFKERPLGPPKVILSVDDFPLEILKCMEQNRFYEGTGGPNNAESEN